VVGNGTPGGRADRADGGSMAIEIVILTPVFVAFILLIVAFGRAVDAQGTVEGAARDAARAASIARSSGAAGQAASDAAASDLANTILFGCQTDLLDQIVPGTQIRVRVACKVTYDDLGLIGLSGSKNVEATVSAPVDTYTWRDS
jgi:Flp pilus assembly protein TadG